MEATMESKCAISLYGSSYVAPRKLVVSPSLQSRHKGATLWTGSCALLHIKQRRSRWVKRISDLFLMALSACRLVFGGLDLTRATATREPARRLQRPPVDVTYTTNNLRVKFLFLCAEDFTWLCNHMYNIKCSSLFAILQVTPSQSL